MAFGRRKARSEDNSAASAAADATDTPDDADTRETSDGEPFEGIGTGEGPYDDQNLPDGVDITEGRLDLGALVIPMPPDAQMQVEMSMEQVPVGVHIATPVGRISPGVFAAPRTRGQWRETVTELAENLRNDGAKVTIEDGQWGREVVAVSPNGVFRFIGVDGPRWMIRFMVVSPPEVAEQAMQVTRMMIAETVVRRGKEPMPARESLEIVLPEEVLAQLQEAVNQQAAALAANETAQQEPALRPTSQGSAMSQLNGHQH